MTQAQTYTMVDGVMFRLAATTRRALPVVSVVVILAAVLSFGNPSEVLAQEPSPISLEVEVGLDGKARVGHWIPVVVRVENTGPDLEAEIHVTASRGHPTSSGINIADVVLPRGSRKRLTLYVPYMTAIPRLEVELVDEGRVVTRLETPVNVIGESDILVGVIGRRAGPWNLLTTLDLPGQAREVAVVPIAPDSFPHRQEALRAFDVIALGDVAVQTLPSETLEALEGWVAGGGTLVLSGGMNAEARLEGLPLHLMPVVPGDTAEREKIPALERLGNEPISASPPIAVNSANVVSGRVLAQEEGLPLAVLSRYGKGSVLFLAFDPVAQPLVGWPGLPQMWRELLFQSLRPSVLYSNQIDGRNRGVTTSQWTYQLHNAMTNLPALEFPSIKVLLGIIAGYILLVGPVNYVMLRWLRRPGLTWFTVPMLVLLFSIGVYLLAVRIKGSDVQVSSVTLVQEAPDTDWARVQRMAGVVVPSQGDYRVEVPGSALVASWDGAGQNVSGLGSSGSIVKVRNRKEISELELLKMGTWTMSSLVTDRIERIEEILSHDLYVEEGHLKGTVTNGSLTPLRQVWLVSTGGVVDLGDLASRDTALVDTSLATFSGILPSWELREQWLFSGTFRPDDARYNRQRHQLSEMATPIFESLYSEPPSDLSTILLAWTDENPMVVTVDGLRPSGPSLTLIAKPVTLHLRGTFSIPSGLLIGRALNIDGEIIGKTSELITFGGGSIAYQFEVPGNVREMNRVSLHVPFENVLPITQDVMALAYHWEDDTWEPLDLKLVPLQAKSSFSGGHGPPPPAMILNPGVAAYSRTLGEITFTGALEGEMGKGEGLDGYVSSTGLIRVKVTLGGGYIGRPSLAIDGIAQ